MTPIQLVICTPSRRNKKIRRCFIALQGFEKEKKKTWLYAYYITVKFTFFPSGKANNKLGDHWVNGGGESGTVTVMFLSV